MQPNEHRVKGSAQFPSDAPASGFAPHRFQWFASASDFWLPPPVTLMAVGEVTGGLTIFIPPDIFESVFGPFWGPFRRTRTRRCRVDSPPPTCAPSPPPQIDCSFPDSAAFPMAASVSFGRLSPAFSLNTPWLNLPGDKISILSP